MNKKLANTGSILNKNLTNTESMTLKALNVNGRINASSAKINSLGVENLTAACVTLDLPTEIPDTYYEGSIYFKHDTQTNKDFSCIYNGTAWLDIEL